MGLVQPRTVVLFFAADTFAWDAENRLISVTPDSPEDGSLRACNEYDHLSRRTAKYVERWYASPGEWRPHEIRTSVYDRLEPDSGDRREPRCRNDQHHPLPLGLDLS